MDLLKMEVKNIDSLAFANTHITKGAKTMLNYSQKNLLYRLGENLPNHNIKVERETADSVRLVVFDRESRKEVKRSVVAAKPESLSLLKSALNLLG